jgi:SAM-dependent methyltransferase
MTSEQLPNKRWFEYSWAKHSNPELTYDQWSPWDEWDYSAADRDRFSRIILNNLDLVTNKQVFDIGCLLGTLSLIMLHNSAQHVTAIDIREHNLSIAQEVCSLAGFNNIDFYHCDLYDTARLLELAGHCETILFSGVFYHINNHYQIIEQLTQTRAQNIILETVINDSDQSTVVWSHEESEDHRAGANNSLKKVMIGFPSVRFCQDLLRHHGWQIKSTDKYHYVPDSADNAHDRCIITATRKL